MSKIKNVLAKAISLASEQPMSYNEAIELLNDIDTCKVKIWLEEGAILPKYAHKEDACMDLFVKDVELDVGRTIYEMEIRPRSSITKTKSVIQNAPGTVDEGYRGEIMVVCRRVDCYDDPSYSVGDKVAQLLIRRRERIVWDQVKSLDDLGYTDRGDGGFGSTGR